MIMKKVLVTGGTAFVSRYIAEYYVGKGFHVSVLNRNTKEQSKGVHLIEADRYHLGNRLCDLHFDVVIDTGYTSEEVKLLLDALGSYDDYIFISSSAVYPDNLPQPFAEETLLGENTYWRKYGTDKIEAEALLQKKDPNAYILRPPYLYGPMNDIYREAFVFDCALADRPFYLPGDGSLKLQFFHIHDLCRFLDFLLERKPEQRIFNVGNEEMISVRDWVSLCYRIVGKKAELVNVYESVEQRNYFSFCEYEYQLDVTRQCEFMKDTIPLEEGLRDSFEWYRDHQDQVEKKPFIDYIDQNLK